MKLGFTILLLCVSVAVSQESPIKTQTLAWDASPTSEKVRGYRVYELVDSHRGGPAGWFGRATRQRVLIGESKTPNFVIPRKNGKHVYVVTAVNANGESAPSAPLQVQN